MLPADNRHDVLMDAAAWKRFPLRGHTITAHQGLLYVIGGKLQGGKDASSHIHVLSLPHVLSKRPALKASVEVSFRIWDHAACLLPPNPLMPHGCICLVAGRAVSNLGFSSQAFLINLDPNSFDVLSVPIRSQSGGKPFVVRSGCALLPHPHNPKAIIMHGGRTAPGVETGKPHTTANGFQTILSDWHVLTLTEHTATSGGGKSIVIQSTELQRRPCIQKADLAACKHCLWAVGNQSTGSKSTSLPVLVCGGSAALEHRPLSTVDINFKSMSVSLRDASSAPGPAFALTSSVCCTSVSGPQGNLGLFLTPIRKPQPAVGVLEVESQAEGRRWAVAQQRTLPLPACDAISPLCVASATVTQAGRNGSVAGQVNGNGKLQGVIVVAQGQVGQNRPVLYVWADSGIGGKVSAPALHPAAIRGGAAQQQLTSSYSGEYALPDSDPIRVEDLQIGRPTSAKAKAKNVAGGKHVSAPAANANKRKSHSAAAALDTKRRRSSAPAPAAAQYGNRENAGDRTAGNGLLQTKHVAPSERARKEACIIHADENVAHKQPNMDKRIIHETPEVSLHDDVTLLGGAGSAHIAESHSGKAGGKSKNAPARRDKSEMLSNAEVEELRHQAQLTIRLESEVASLQQTLQERVQHANAADEQVVNLKLQINDLQAALTREKACLSEARMLKDAALRREAGCERRLQAAAQQTTELGKMKNDAVVQQNRIHEAESARDKLQARAAQLQHELTLAQSARTRDVSELQSRANDLSKEKEDYIAQQQKLQGEKDALEAECTKARAAGEQNQEQLEALRKKIEAADQKLEEEQQQRLREVKEIQEFHKAHVSELENRLRLEKVNRDTAEARHTSEVQKCNGRIKYLEDVTRMCQEGADLSSKRADDLAEQLQDCKTKLEAAQQDHNKLKDAAATHEKLAAQAQETVTTLQAEVTEVRKELKSIKDKLQDAETNSAENQRTISERDAEIAQLQHRQDNHAVFYQDMMQAAQARQKAMENLSACHSSLSAAQKDEGEAFANFAKKQAAAQHQMS